MGTDENIGEVEMQPMTFHNLGCLKWETSIDIHCQDGHEDSDIPDGAMHKDIDGAKH